MLLGLNLLKQTKDDFLNDLSAVASAQSTLIFIDTNILAYCSGQLIPDTELSFSSATAGASPSLN